MKLKGFVFVLLLCISADLLYSEVVLDEAPLYYKIRGDHYRRIGLYDKALNEYEKAISLKSDFPECYYWSAYIFYKKKLYSQALFELISAKKYKDKFNTLSKYYDTMYLEIEIYFKINDSDSIKKGKESLDEIIEFSKNYRNKVIDEYRQHVTYQLGKGLYLKGKYLTKESLKDRLLWFDQAIRFNYKPALCYFYQYLLYKKEFKDSEKANHYLLKARKINPNIFLEFNEN